MLGNRPPRWPTIDARRRAGIVVRAFIQPDGGGVPIGEAATRVRR